MKIKITQVATLQREWYSDSKFVGKVYKVKKVNEDGSVLVQRGTKGFTYPVAASHYEVVS